MSNSGISSLMIRKYRIVDGEEFQGYFKRSMWLMMLAGASLISVIYCLFLSSVWSMITGQTHFTLTMAFVGSLTVLFLSVILLEYTRMGLVVNE